MDTPRIVISPALQRGRIPCTCGRGQLTRYDTARFQVPPTPGAVLREKTYRCGACGVIVRTEETVRGISQKANSGRPR